MGSRVVAVEDEGVIVLRCRGGLVRKCGCRTEFIFKGWTRLCSDFELGE